MLHRISELKKVARNENVARNGHVKSYATSSAATSSLAAVVRVHTVVLVRLNGDVAVAAFRAVTRAAVHVVGVARLVLPYSPSKEFVTRP